MQRWVTWVVALSCIVGAVGLAWWSVLRPVERNAEVAWHTVKAENLVATGVPKEAIPMITAPAFESVRAADAYLEDAGLGIAVAVSGTHRFYPFQVLAWHAALEDTLDGVPVLVVYCPLCGTGVVFDRRTAHATSTPTFFLADKMMEGDLLLQDRATQSLWSRTLGMAVVGPLAGDVMALHPTFLNIPWADFKRTHPNGDVLSRKTGVSRDYTRGPLARTTLGAKESVAGVTWRGASRAYPVGILEQGRALNGSLGGSSILVLPDPIGGVRAFVRPTFGDRALTFTAAGEHLLTDGRGGTWDWSGLALEGPLKGTRLERIPATKTLWFIWAASHPESEVWAP